MRNVTLWKIGIIRCIALLIAGVAFHGIVNGLEKHVGWNIDNLSIPASLAFMLAGIAIYILGYRTERDYAEIVELAEAERRADNSGATSDRDIDRAGQGRNCS